MSLFTKLKRQKIPLALSLVVLALVCAQNFSDFAARPFHSVEVRIAEHSPLGTIGGAVVPASCPSYSHSGTCPACGANQIYSQSVTTQCDGNGNCGNVTVDSCADCPAGYTSNADHTACVNACVANQGASCSASNACGSNTGTIQCNGTCSATAPTCNPPTVTIVSTSGGTPGSTASVLSGGSVTISWSCPATGNTSSSGTSNNPSSPFSTGGAMSGSANVTVTNNTTFTVQCNSSGLQSSVSATVVNANLSLTASPSRVQPGNASTLTWSANSVQSCTLSGPNVSASATADVNGTVSSHNTSSGAITGRSVYTLTCQTSGGTLSTSVTVTLIPNVIEI